ncbi:GNAT family N-acetyltransferase [Deefgea piscis]|uniref:GNAT family N-acetyltransferase n=1 Tax=Deefgea piscis TaxID=2739061 RepID=A0A6M8SRY0_9NEIS|nr:GNAT family N-acetyltransferase [Deefgea piscis]QKJ67431.1 GNAT family N-acetyltransferase [Deefgea piscis]
MISRKIRLMHPDDFNAILALQSDCYPTEFIETAQTLQQKQQLAPHSSWVITLNEQISGYLFCHPWFGEKLPALNSPLNHLPETTDRFYIHDLAISPGARGNKLAEQLIQHAITWAIHANFSQVMLVAVLGADHFWRKHQFKPLPTPLPAAYGEDAICMLRQL